MPDPVEVFRGLVSHLKEEHGFGGGEPTRLIRETSVLYVTSAYPAALFLDWLQRCPEAREYLAKALSPPLALEGPGREEPTPPVSRPLPAGQIWAMVFGRLQPVWLRGVVGGILKVEEIAPDGKVGRRADMTLDQVPWWARDQARDEASRLPGHKEHVAFADELDSELREALTDGQTEGQDPGEERIATDATPPGRNPLGLDKVLLQGGGPGDGVQPEGGERARTRGDRNCRGDEEKPLRPG